MAERINAAEREELRLLIADVLAEDSAEDRREAWQVAMADPYAALECFRALFHAKKVFIREHC